MQKHSLVSNKLEGFIASSEDYPYAHLPSILGKMRRSNFLRERLAGSATASNQNIVISPPPQAKHG